MQDHDDHLLIHLMESKKVSPVLHTFYSSCINRDNNDAISKAHFPKMIKRLENMLHKHGMWHTVGVLQTLNIVSFFKYSVTVDSTNSKKFNFVLEQPVRFSEDEHLLKQLKLFFKKEIPANFYKKESANC